MQTTQITIRRALPSDLIEIDRIEREAFPDPWETHIFEEALSLFSTTFFVAMDGEGVSGFIISGTEFTGEETYGHICNLAVDKRKQKSGIGRKLVQRVEHEFLISCASGIQLEVRLSNIKAQNFYRRLGYRDALRFANYYANGEDALVMMKWFRL